ncbi:hypothetical protein PsW64_00840 [Pseudovibrio sp. W64]|uniref:DUF1192 domain-containing protein n=1 Tax=Pseudovibrio sp. W64 TaxID=1735583 RepID=UPI0007AE4B4F|nr:DUF1192 domain-containing protein [Pseudovibrio sp. W64]KZK88277.1 hypothetical protein PsW64_00840 [Pseudovibrio sp. W64]
MGLFDDDDTPRPATSGVMVGEPLTNLSIHELNEHLEHLEQLKAEIVRVENEIETKSSANSSAESFFK